MNKFKPTVVSVRDPAWANPEQTSILVWVLTDYVNTELPFSADKNDTEPHGRDIFARCVAGEFGEIAEFDVSRSYNLKQDLALPPHFDQSFLFYFDKIGRFFEEANTEVKSGSIRGICLVNACMVEAVVKGLVQALCKKRNLSEDACATMIRRKVWRNNFESQNLMLKELGCIDQNHFDTLEAIRRIRNEFSHKWRLSLDDEDWKSKIIALFEILRLSRKRCFLFPEFNMIEDLDFLTRTVFAGACLELVLHLLAEGYKEGIHSLEAF